MESRTRIVGIEIVGEFPVMLKRRNETFDAMTSLARCRILLSIHMGLCLEVMYVPRSTKEYYGASTVETQRVKYCLNAHFALSSSRAVIRSIRSPLSGMTKTPFFFTNMVCCMTPLVKAIMGMYGGRMTSFRVLGRREFWIQGLHLENVSLMYHFRV